MHTQTMADTASSWRIKLGLVIGVVVLMLGALIVAPADIPGLSLGVSVVSAETGPSGNATFEDAKGTLEDVVTTGRQILVFVGGLVVGLIFTVGGLQYMLAGGSPQQMEVGKMTMKAAAIGLGIVMLGGTIGTIIKELLSSASGAAVTLDGLSAIPSHAGDMVRAILPDSITGGSA